jgi:hypothetical protein
VLRAVATDPKQALPRSVLLAKRLSGRRAMVPQPHQGALRGLVGTASAVRFPRISSKRLGRFRTRFSIQMCLSARAAGPVALRAPEVKMLYRRATTSIRQSKHWFR